MGQIVNLTELERSLATLTATSIFSRVEQAITELRAVDEKDEDWLSDVCDLLEFSIKVESGFGHTKACALAVVKEAWDHLPFSLRLEYGLDFMTFARNATGKERSTIDNYVNTARIWLIDKHQPPFGKVTIPVRDKENKPVLDGSTGKVLQQDVPFNPYLIDMTKLLVVNARAKAQEMTDNLWSMLVDDYYTVEDLRLAVLGTETTNGTSYETYYSIEGPGLFASRNNETVCIAPELNWEEYDHNDLVKETIDKLCTCLNIELDEDKMYREMRREN